MYVDKLLSGLNAVRHRRLAWKTVVTDVGPVTIEVPRDREGSFEKINAILEEMNDWLVRPLDRVYPVVLIDAIHVNVRDGQVANRAFYCAVGVTADGKRDILGIWISQGGEGANRPSDRGKLIFDERLHIRVSGVR